MANNKPLQPKNNDENARNATSATVPEVETRLEYEEHETQYHNDVLQLIRDAKTERERPRKEFDGMTYTQHIERSYELDLAYTPPAVSKNDVRLVNGITREKTTTAINTVTGFNFDTAFIAFDQDDRILTGLAQASGDLVEKSNQIEYWNDKRKEVYRGMAWAGTFFTMETQEFPTRHSKSRVPLGSFGKIDVEWSDMIRKTEVVFRTMLLDPRMVIVGNPNEMDLDKQPFIALARVVSEAEARALFGSWDRWKYVPLRKGVVMRGDSGNDVFAEYCDKYSVSGVLSEGKAEIVYFMRSMPYGNELGIYLNGVAMLPVKNRGKVKGQERYNVSGFPLSSWSHSGNYPITDWHTERITNFFYSKGIPAKTKFDQEVADFWIRYLVRKAQRSADPTLVNNTGVNITSDMVMPRTILTGIKEDRIKPLLPAEMLQGITVGESGFYEMIKREIDEKTTSREFSGITTNQYQSAKQFTSNQRAQLLQLAAITDGVILGEKKRALLRLQNSIIPYWFNKQDKEKRPMKIADAVVDIYDSFTLDKKSSGQKNDKSINIADIDVSDPNAISELEFNLLAQEDREEKETGVKTSRVLLDPDHFDFMRTLFYVHVKQRERENDATKKADLDADIAKAMNIFGPRVNMEKMEEKYAKVRNENVEDWFGGEVTPEQELARAMGGASPQSIQQAMQTGGMEQGGFNPASTAPPASIALS